MINFQGIEWPTAVVAVILSVLLSVPANILKEELIRWRENRIGTRQNKIDWYNEVLRISATLHVSLVVSHSTLLSADEVVRDDMEERAIRLASHLADTNELDEESKEEIRDIDDLEERYRGALLEHYEPYKEEIFNHLFQEADQTYTNLRGHYVNCLFDIDDEIATLIEALLANCFLVKAKGEMTSRDSAEIKNVSGELAEMCQEEVNNLK